MLFTRFRQPRWQHKDPEVRRQAVARMSNGDGDDRDRLRDLARNDPNAGVRSTAAKRLNELGLLRDILTADPDAQVREVASLRFRQLITGGMSADGDLNARIEELARCQDPQLLAHAMRNGREESFRAAVLERVTDRGVIEEVALHDPVARLRQAAVQRLDDLAALERIATVGRQTDRRIARVARQRADALRHRARERERLVSAAEVLCEEATALVDRAHFAGSEPAEASRLRNRWDSLGALPDAAPKDRFDVLMTRIEERLSEAPGRHESEGEASGRVMREALDRLERTADVQADHLSALEVGLAAAADLDESVHARASDWLSSGRRFLANRADLNSGEADSIRDAIDRIAWPTHLPAPPELAAARNGAGPAVADDSDVSQPSGAAGPGDVPQKEFDRADALARLDERLDALEGCIEAGRLKHARREMQRARQIAECVTGSLPRGHERRLARGVARLAELKDWRRFAVLPKQEDLCRRMEALVDDEELSLPDRARRIRELQDQWKATGGSDSPEARALWRRFSDASRRAFAPCRDYFSREAARRTENLEARRVVAEQLREFLAGAELAQFRTTDLERIRRTARDDWRRAGPVDQEGGVEVTAAFERDMDALTAEINRQRDLAGDRKAELIREAEALVDAGDTEAAAARAKALQTEWKAVGAARPSRERAHWKAFRAACDRIFERRDSERAEAKGRAQVLVSDAETVCAHLEEAVVAEADEGTLRSTIESADQRYATLSLPDDRVGRALGHRFDRARERAIEQLGRHSADRRRQVLRSALDGGASMPGAPDIGDALPESVTAALAEAGDKSGDPDHRHQLCVELEIRAGVESPEADRELRMQQQVARLAKGFADRHDGDPTREAWDILAQWIREGGVADEALRPRVLQAMDVLLAQR